MTLADYMIYGIKFCKYMIYCIFAGGTKNSILLPYSQSVFMLQKKLQDYLGSSFASVATTKLLVEELLSTASKAAWDHSVDSLDIWSRSGYNLRQIVS